MKKKLENITPKQITGAIQSNPPVLGQTIAANHFVGLAIEVKGVVLNVDPRFKYVTVNLLDTEGIHISCNFDLPVDASVALIKTGDELTINGIIFNATKDTVVLDHCRLAIDDKLIYQKFTIREHSLRMGKDRSPEKPWYLNARIIVPAAATLLSAIIGTAGTIYVSINSAPKSTSSQSAGDDVLNNDANKYTAGRDINIYNGQVSMFAASSSRNFSEDFPKVILELLEKENPDKRLLIFAESGNREVGDFACDIHGFLAMNFRKITVWPDSESGFSKMNCIKTLYDHPAFSEDVKVFSSLSGKIPITEANGVRVLDIDSEKIVIWVTGDS